jgi:flagellar hook assembly protein FlgD
MEPSPTLVVSAPVVDPAPVVDSGSITSSITVDASVTVEIRNARGQLVRRLIAGVLEPAGSIEAIWDRRDARGKRVKAGTYVAVVQAVGADGVTVRRESGFLVL